MMSHFAVYAPIRNVGIDIVPWLQQRRRRRRRRRQHARRSSLTRAREFLISQNSYKPATLSRRQFPRNLSGMPYISTNVPFRKAHRERKYVRPVSLCLSQLIFLEIPREVTLIVFMEHDLINFERYNGQQ